MQVDWMNSIEWTPFFGTECCLWLKIMMKSIELTFGFKSALVKVYWIILGIKTILIWRWGKVFQISEWKHKRINRTKFSISLPYHFSMLKNKKFDSANKKQLKYLKQKLNVINTKKFINKFFFLYTIFFCKHLNGSFI